MTARWTTVEDQRLADLYADGLPLVVIAGRLGRSEDALVARRSALGIVPRGHPRGWSARLDALIVASAEAGVPARAVAERLGLSVHAVRRRRRQLTPGRAPAPRYRAEEDDALRAVVAAGGSLDELADGLGRSVQALRLRARTLGVLECRPRSRWTEEEDRLLRACYAAGLTCAAIAAELPHDRSAEAVAARARRLGLATYARQWAAFEDEQLRALVRTGTALEDAALALDRTPEALRRRARKLGLQTLPARARADRVRPWTEREDRLLRATPGVNPAALAAALGRSDRAVLQRRRALGLHEGRERSPHHRLAAGDALTAGEAQLERQLAAGAAHRRQAVAG